MLIRFLLQRLEEARKFIRLQKTTPLLLPMKNDPRRRVLAGEETPLLSQVVHLAQEGYHTIRLIGSLSAEFFVKSLNLIGLDL